MDFDGDVRGGESGDVGDGGEIEFLEIAEDDLAVERGEGAEEGCQVVAVLWATRNVQVRREQRPS